MTVKITEECIFCGKCEPVCPNNAIFELEEIYAADPLLCNECVGFHTEEACMNECEVDAVITDPDNRETEIELIARAKKLHPEKNFGEDFKSRFRN